MIKKFLSDNDLIIACEHVCVYNAYTMIILCIHILIYIILQINLYYERRTCYDIEKCVYSLCHIIIILHKVFKTNSPDSYNNNLVK